MLANIVALRHQCLFPITPENRGIFPTTVAFEPPESANRARQRCVGLTGRRNSANIIGRGAGSRRLLNLDLE